MWLFLKSSIRADCHGCVHALHCPERSMVGVMIWCLEEVGAPLEWHTEKWPLLWDNTRAVRSWVGRSQQKKEAVNLRQKKCTIKGSRRVSGVWIKHHLVQASTSRRLFPSHWTSSTAAFPGLERVVMALFAFNYLATSYKLLWRELIFISFVKGGIPERQTQSHGSCCKCSLYNLCMAFN